ncbi:MAG: hypothetical protein QT00_C0002G0268 [archaeon GW2011_AR5]|nr:MAG: hypothetical protein QT00_C0002G0268 [archaeon GW2011_AR5]MBS3051640.1 hypothetical protein [Candidatus Aenigmarchaeota archaeon]
MLTYDGHRVVEKEVAMTPPEQEPPIHMSVNGVNVTGRVYATVLDPPDEVILYMSHNGAKDTRTLTGTQIQRSRACRELGIFYRPDECGYAKIEPNNAETGRRSRHVLDVFSHMSYLRDKFRARQKSKEAAA